MTRTQRQKKIRDILEARPDLRIALRFPESGFHPADLHDTIRRAGLTIADMHDVTFEAINWGKPTIQVVIIGKKQSGKTTAAEFIAAARPAVKSIDTSAVLYTILAEQLGITEEELRSRPKEEIRPQLIATGDTLTSQNPLAIIGHGTDLSSTEFAIAGIRTADQLVAIREVCPNSVTLWIDRDNHDPSGVDNLALTERSADLIVRNNGSQMGPFRVAVMTALIKATRRF